MVALGDNKIRSRALLHDLPSTTTLVEEVRYRSQVGRTSSSLGRELQLHNTANSGPTVPARGLEMFTAPVITYTQLLSNARHETSYHCALSSRQFSPSRLCFCSLTSCWMASLDVSTRFSRCYKTSRFLSDASTLLRVLQHRPICMVVG